MIIRTCVALLLSVLPALAAAGTPAGSYDEPWRWAHFTTASGLPTDFVLDAAEAGGRFWAVTKGGIAWFDGYRWHKVPGAPDAIAESGGLVADDRGTIVLVAAGRLYAGSERGVREVAVFEGSQRVELIRCAKASSGPVLVCSRGSGIYEWDGAACRRHEPSRVLGRVFTLVSGNPASAWASAERGLWRWNGSAWDLRLHSEGERLSLVEAAEQPAGAALAIVEAPVDWRGLWRWGRSRSPDLVRGMFAAPIVSVALGENGEIVAAHNSGEVVRRTPAGWEPISPGPLPLDARSVGFLRNHDLWVASDHGLFVHRRSSDRWRVQVIPRPDDRNTINEIARTPGGQILLATGRGILEDSGGNRPDEAISRTTQSLGALTGLAVDGRGRLWAASGYSFTGLRRRDEAGRWRQPDLHPALDASYVHRIARDRSGSLWFLALGGAPRQPGRPETGGAYRLRADDTVERWSTEDGLPSPRIYAFAEGPDGAYWFGTASGISRWRAGQWRHWTPADGLQTNRVFALAVDPQGVAWFAHQDARGLGRLEHDRISYVTTDDGLATDAIWSVHVDDHGRLWVAGDGGVSVLRHGVWTSFGARAGLTSTRIWPVLSADDRLYLGTRGGGLVVLNLRDESTPPSIVVPQAPVVDERGLSIRWRAFAWWGDAEPGAVLTRTRIDNRPWTAWSTDRELNAAGLAPGPHDVSFQAKDVLGTESAVVPRVSVSVPPRLIRRPEFFVPVGGLTLVAAGLLAVLARRKQQHHLELRHREEQFIRTFQASPLAASITALEDGRFLEVNDALTRLAACARNELIGNRAEEIGLAAEDYDRNETAKAIRTGEALRGIPLRTRRRSGERLDLVGYFQAIEFDGRPAILGQYLDVTDQRRLEDQLRQAQKMESIGRLAGGVAHDFNNLLTVIIGNAALIDADLAHGDPRRDGIEQITIAADRAERLTRQLLSFARRQVVEPKVVQLNDLVLGTDRVLRRLIGEDIELVTIPAPDLPPVFVDPNQMEQVIWNMAVNARDAMPGGGALTIRTSAVVLREGEGEDQGEARAGAFVRLSLSDTGMGMDRAVRARLFEPFFTTKGPGKGTGLGLATCYGIVKQAGGHILVESEPGHGSTFHVDLPPAPASRAVEEPRERAAETPGGAETILLAEDEVQVRRLAASVLRQRGYHVLEAENGQDGLHLSDQYHGRIDLLITDVVMPLMRGTELAQQVRMRRPGLRVLFVSGYADNDAFRQEAGADRVAFLAKPFTPAALARRVRELLDEAAGS